MRSFRIFNQRATAVFAAAALVFATLIPSLAGAATVTSRSIALSTSVKAATLVKYDVKFTVPTSSTGAFALQFCDTPDIGTACSNSGDSAGLSTASVDTDGTDTVSAIGTNGVKVVLNTAKTAGQQVDVELKGITNPTNAGVVYGRIVTYTDSTAYGFVAGDDLDGAADDKPPLDQGSVALTITDGFKVSGRALETLVFCASGENPSHSNPITTGCTGTLYAPNLTLGTDGILTSTASTGTVYTQISTNAAGGAVVSLKSSTSGCGGLVREGSSSNAVGCGITPLTTAAASITDGTAKFGLKLGSLGGASGTTTVAVGNYSDTTYYMGYNSTDESTGVTSTYGDPIYKTSNDGGTTDGPVSDGSADLTFAANVGALTPAGNYSASLNLVATGKF